MPNGWPTVAWTKDHYQSTINSNGMQYWVDKDPTTNTIRGTWFKGIRLVEEE